MRSITEKGQIGTDFVIERFLFMIRLVIVYFERAVYLLCEHNAEELMRERHIAERKQHVCAALNAWVQPEGAAYYEHYAAFARKHCRADVRGEGFARQLFALYAQGYDMIALRPSGAFSSATSIISVVA